MRLFKKKAFESQKSFDPAKEEPLLRASICTGETVAGFKDLATGKFNEVMIIRSPQDLVCFKNEYGIEGEIKKEY